MASRLSSAVVPWLAAATLLFAFWMLLVDTREAPQLIAGVAVAAIGATGGELVRRQQSRQIRLRWRWLWGSWRAATPVPADLLRLTRAAVAAALPGRRARSGRFRALAFELGRPDPEDRGRYALAELAGSFSPNTYVVGVDRDRRALLVHQLIPKEEHPERSIDPLGLR